MKTGASNTSTRFASVRPCISRETCISPLRTSELIRRLSSAKLIYWHPHVSYNKYGWKQWRPGILCRSYHVRSEPEGLCRAYVDQNGVLQGDVLHQVATLTGDRWYVVEVQLTMESSIGAGDGFTASGWTVVLFYEDTTLQLDRPCLDWSASPNGGNGTPHDLADVYFERFDVGDQTDSTGNFDEYRYWDNVAFSNHAKVESLSGPLKPARAWDDLAPLVPPSSPGRQAVF